MSNKNTTFPDDIPNLKFNLEAQETFVKNRGIVIEHWAAIPSPIGLKDRGDYRRSTTLDIFASNGFIYKKVGEFIGVIIGNRKSNKNIEGGIYDESRAYLILPKYYTKVCDNSKDNEIALLPGDRLYASNIELKVPNYQRFEYHPDSVDRLQFPILCVQQLMDSLGREYKQGYHYKITKDGDIKWIAGRKNPGIDPDTGRGRIYGIRYKYLAFWYVHQLINEIRITNIDTSEEPKRLPYFAVIQREYVYRDQSRGDSQNSNTEQHNTRTQEKPQEKIDPNEYEVNVNVGNLSE